MARILLALVVVLACACDEPTADQPDASAGDAAVSGDALAPDSAAARDAEPRPDADPNLTCNTELMTNVVAGREIRVDDYCDDIFLCAADSAAAAAIMAIEPGFMCDQGQGSCEPGEVACQWYTIDVVDSGDYESLCAISVLDDAPEMTCFIYL